MSAPRQADVAVVGAGVVGLAAALEIARRGADVVVLAAPGRHVAGDDGLVASGAVAAQARLGVDPEPWRDLALLSRHLFGDFVEAAEEDAGFSCEYDVRGALAIALSDAAEVELDRALDWQRSRALPVEVLPAEEALAREPGLTPAARAAFSFPRDGQVDPARLVRVLSAALAATGGLVLPHATALALRVESGRAAGVETPEGPVLAALVLDTGAGAGPRLANAPALPLEVRRAIAVTLDASEDPDRLRRLAVARGVSLAPRRDGRLVAAGSQADSGFDPRPSAKAVASLLDRAAEAVPAVSRYALLEVRGALTATSPDGVPILGETALPGYHVAAGFGDDATLLAPGAAALLSELFGGGSPPLAASPFSPARFDV